MSILTLEKEVTPTVALPRRKEQSQSNGGLPALESGDRLSRAEFERRYRAHPEIKKAELIEGVVYVASPVRARQHGIPHSDIIGWLTVYRAATPGIQVADNSTLRLDLDNEPQPDVSVWREGGQAFIDGDDYLRGAPELIVEVAGSSASIDLGDKLAAYRRNGVQEYLVLLTHEREIRWCAFEEGETRQLKADDQGVVRSQALPGLWLATTQFWAGDLAGLLAVLQQGLATPEHAAYSGQSG